MKCKYELQMLAALSGQLCDMLCDVLKIGVKLKFDHVFGSYGIMGSLN
jgi:hypothetical protein